MIDDAEKEQIRINRRIKFINVNINGEVFEM